MVMWLIQLHTAQSKVNGNENGRETSANNVGSLFVLHHQANLGPKGPTTPMLCHRLVGRSNTCKGSPCGTPEPPSSMNLRICSHSIGTVLVAGMTIGTVFTLFVVPVFYSLIAADHKASVVTDEVEDRGMVGVPVVA